MSPILNYTTRIATERTVAQVQSLLARHGASHVIVQYKNGVPDAVAFAYPAPGGAANYRLPVRPKRVQAVLIKQQVPNRYRSLEHATNVAWRIALDWLKSQVAYAETEQVDVAEIMLPYVLVRGGENGDPGITLYEDWAAQRSLPEPERG